MITSSLEQQAEYIELNSPQAFEDALNRRGDAGWLLRAVTQVVTRKSGFYSCSGYHNDDLLLIFRRTGGRHAYRCVLLQREPSFEKDLHAINESLASHNAQGFEMIAAVHLSVIPDKPEHRTMGTAAHFLIFSRPE